MNCQNFRQDLYSGSQDPAFTDHLASCASCRNLYQKVNDTMSILDHIEDAPAQLLVSVMKKQAVIEKPLVRSLNFMSYLQIAAAIMFGIIIGHKAGQHAEPGALKARKNPVKQYIAAHHLNVNDNDLDLSSLLLK